MIALYELIELLPDSFQPSFPNRLNELFIFLQNEDKKITEEKAAALFFKSKNRGKYFNKLKNALKSEITKYIIANPSTWVDTVYKAFHEDCYKSFASYKILLTSGRGRAGIEMAKQLLPKLQQVELHALQQIVANDLLFHYSSIDPSPIQIKKYEQLAQTQLELVKAEGTIRKCLGRVSFICSTRESYNSAIIEEFKAIEKKVTPYLNLGSNQLNYLIYIIIISRYSVVYDYKNIIKYCDEALNGFAVGHPNYNAFRFAFIQNKIPSLVGLGHFDTAKSLAKEAGKMMPVGNFNWHLILIRRIIICFHAGDFQEAYDLYKAHDQQNCSSPNLVEYWNIIWGYLYLLIQMGKIKQYTEERFYLGKFLNEMPMYSRDKAGNNINILLLQILVRIQRGQYGHIIDRIESLRAYARKYTRNPETSRANIFINMIVKMEAASFHKAGTERKVTKLWEQLNQSPLRVGRSLAIEMIPYTMLWKEVLGMLDNKFRTVGSQKTIAGKTKKRNRKV